MKQFLIFIGGLIMGIFSTLLVLYVISIRMASNYLNNEVQAQNEVQVQYVEVKGKKGNVTLHTGMPKDSVRILLGKTDEINLNGYFENWGYKLKNNYVSDLDIDFEQGKLTGVQQN